jgi:hypothetical protein
VSSKAKTTLLPMGLVFQEISFYSAWKILQSHFYKKTIARWKKE